MGTKIRIKGLNLWYDQKQALRDISMDIPERMVTAIIGPSGCGKSTLIRCLNRMNDSVENCRIEGSIIIDGKDVLQRKADVIELRRKVGMVFQKPNPFPFSVRDNVTYGCRMAGLRKKELLDRIVVSSLEKAALYDELKNRLDAMATDLSGGQQQRLCVARSIAMKPEILLMDEPCSALDPIATSKIENLITDLKSDYTVVIVTHNMQQAARVSDFTAFMYLGELKEFGRTSQIFQNPRDMTTEAYLRGGMG